MASADSQEPRQGVAAYLAAAAGERPAGRHPLLHAMGGVLGVVEAVLPGTLFVILFVLTGAPDGIPWFALGVSVASSVVFFAIRLIRRQSIIQALAGLIGVLISAALAIFTHRAENNFLWGIMTNAIYFLAFGISMLLRWPLIGLAVGWFKGEKTAWRQNRSHFRLYLGVTAIWTAMFLLRIAVEIPLYVSGNTAALGIAKLVLGLPIYAPVLVLSWLLIRGVYLEDPKSENKAG